MPGKPQTRTQLAKIHKEGGAPAILDQVAAGKSLSRLAREWGISRQLLSGVANSNANKDAYRRARHDAAAVMVEESLEIADACEVDPNAIGKAKLQVDMRRWAAARMDPDTWADRQAPMVAIQINGLHLDSLRQIRAPVEADDD